MRRKTIMAATIAGAAALGTAAGVATNGQAERPDCPGKIVCPLTGELICADQCPFGDAKTEATPVAAEPECCCESAKR